MSQATDPAEIGKSLARAIGGVILFPLILASALAHVTWLGFAVFHYVADHPLDRVMRGDGLWRAKTAMNFQIALTVAWCFAVYHFVRTRSEGTEVGKWIIYGLMLTSGLVTLWWVYPEFR